LIGYGPSTRSKVEHASVVPCECDFGHGDVRARPQQSDKSNLRYPSAA
jgi:hypothetical protein